MQLIKPWYTVTVTYFNMLFLLSAKMYREYERTNVAPESTNVVYLQHEHCWYRRLPRLHLTVCLPAGFIIRLPFCLSTTVFIPVTFDSYTYKFRLWFSCFIGRVLSAGRHEYRLCVIKPCIWWLSMIHCYGNDFDDAQQNYNKTE